jgi:AcrR family transcriptional regulator
MTTLLNRPSSAAPCPATATSEKSKARSWRSRAPVRRMRLRRHARSPTVAERAGLSKQNLMYYFPTKQALYQRVLDDVLDDWLARMASLADPQGPGRRAARLRAAKLRFSREQPLASRVYAMEVIGGAKLYGEQIRHRVVPLLRQDIAVFERWIAEAKGSRRSTPPTCCLRSGR